QHLLDRSPMELLEPPANGKSRERVLSTDELKAVYKTARKGTTPFHTLVTLLILTGQRKGEISRLERKFIGEDRITLPAEITKNGRVHSLPIGKLTQAVLAQLPKAGYLFPSARAHVNGKPSTTMTGFSERKRDFDKECGVTNYTIHDIRRTFATNLAALGTPIHVTEKILNHVSGVGGGLVSVYQRHEFWPEQVAAIEKWEAKLTTLLNTSP
ncbi:MAG: site-specific integrase, partial [Fimbriimonadaceae bacterium]